MALHIFTIASGSKGNCTYIASETTKILVDAGVGIRRVSAALGSVGASVGDLAGVLVTHEHTDHISGLCALSDRGVPVYAPDRLFAAVCRRTGATIPFVGVDFFDAGFTVGDILVRPFRTPHDSAYSVGYTFSCGRAKVGVATDIGHINDAVIANLSGCHTVLLESNHDTEMLLKGGYAPRLKQRIRGANGHLSNDSAAIIVSKLVNSGLKRVILAHLSEENNCPEIAFETVVEALTRCGKKEGSDVFVEVASQNDIGELYSTDE